MQINAIIEHDQEGFFAYVPALKGCVSQGNTVEDTLANIKEAIELYLEEGQMGSRGKWGQVSQSYIFPYYIET